MKRGFCLLLALLICAPLLGGCGTGASPAAAAPDSVSTANGAGAAETDEAQAAEYAVDDPALHTDFVCADNDRVFYEIFVGSFADSDRDGTGDLRGIIEHMHYLNDGDPDSGKSLGIEGIWLTPIFLSPSYHKYDVTDYYRIDPAFGTLDDLRELCALCHARNVKLILDLPLNHTGAQNAWFTAFCAAHREGRTDDPMYDFYSFLAPGEDGGSRTFLPIEGSEDRYECNFSPDMPELNFDSEAVRAELVRLARFYLELGADGFRFDAAKYVYLGEDGASAAFWDWYMGELRALSPEIYTVAEVWSADAITDLYYGAFNCFDFTLSQAEGLIARTAAGGNADKLTSYEEAYLRGVRAMRPDASIVPFLANHDMDRAAGFLPLSNGRMQMAANLYLLGPGSPFIYYGEELGVRGSRGGSNTDADRRLPMPWGDGKETKDPPGAVYPANKRFDAAAAAQTADPGSLYTYYKTLLMIRHANPEIARGDYRALAIPDSRAGGFVSEWKGRAVCVLHNPTTKAETLDLAAFGESRFTRLAAAIGAGDSSLDGTVLTLGAQSSAVLRAD